jgi:CRP/FNR family transcriptional regulator, cyclic AMP receptor protein
MQIIPTLSQVQVFEGLNEKQLNLVSGFLKEISFAEREFIVRENTDGDAMYILIEGTARVTKKLIMDFQGLESENKNLATYQAEDLPSFGENGLVGNGKRNANVQAITKCKLLQFTKQDFDEIAKLDIQTAFLILKNIALIITGRLDRTDKNVVKLATALSLSVGR